ALADLREHDRLGPRDVLTPAGRAEAEEAEEGVAAIPRAAAHPGPPTAPPLTAGVIAPPLRDPEARRKMGFEAAEGAPVPVMAELNLRFAGGADAAFRRLDRLWRRVTGGAGPTRISEQYATG